MQELVLVLPPARGVTLTAPGAMLRVVGVWLADGHAWRG
ncbi:hypothetical protein A2U01_0089385, partial [Trifolium medium]|nr:hypothetical protein [Trifolium medium]